MHSSRVQDWSARLRMVGGRARAAPPTLRAHTVGRRLLSDGGTELACICKALAEGRLKNVALERCPGRWR